MKKKSLAAVISTVLAMSLVTGCGGTNSMAPTKASASEQGGSAGGNESPKESGGAGESKTSDAGNVTPAGEFPIVKEPITLKVAAIDETYVGALGDVDFCKWYEEKTGIHIEWNEIPRDGYKEKLNLMLSTGNLPDVILGITGTEST